MAYYRILQPDELMHYGVKGMKWGKRTARPTAYTNENGARKYLAGRQTNVTGKGKGLERRKWATWDGHQFGEVTAPGLNSSKPQMNSAPSTKKKNKDLKLLRDDSRKGGQSSWDQMQKRKNNRKAAIEYYKANIRENQEAIRDNGNDPAYARNTAFNKTRIQVNQRKLANVVNASARSASGYSSSSSSTKKKKSTGKVRAVVK